MRRLIKESFISSIVAVDYHKQVYVPLFKSFISSALSDSIVILHNPNRWAEKRPCFISLFKSSNKFAGSMFFHG